MPRMIHNLLCNVSRRYRAAHCRHVDELPRRVSRRLRDECLSDIDPVGYGSAADMWAAMEREWEVEGRARVAKPAGLGLGKAAVFA